jgi:hypothetical protein
MTAQAAISAVSRSLRVGLDRFGRVISQSWLDGVTGSTAAGYRPPIVPPDTLDEPPPVAGYFVIDSSTHTRWLGLTKDEFDARCKALGIVADLEPPSHLKR